MNKKKRKKEKKSKTLSRVVTLVLGLGFAGSTLAIALSSVFSQDNYSATDSNNAENAPSIDEQIQLQVNGYEKVLEREPENITALEGLAQIYLQTGQLKKAIPALEKLVEYYPEQQQYAGILQIVKQQSANQPEAAPSEEPQTTPETE